jgi:hypothetical protein
VKSYVVDRGSREIRGLASVDRIRGRVTAYWAGVGGGGRTIRGARATLADFADKAREVFPDPGASKVRTEHERSSLESQPMVWPHPFRM